MHAPSWLSPAAPPTRAGAHVTCTERPKCLGELVASIDAQQAERTDTQRAEHEALGGSIESVELEWGQDAWPQSPLSRKGKACAVTTWPLGPCDGADMGRNMAEVAALPQE